MRNGILAGALVLNLVSCAALRESYRDARDVMVIEDVHRTSRGNDCDALFWPYSQNCQIYCYEDKDDLVGFSIHFLREETANAWLLEETYCSENPEERYRIFSSGQALDLEL